MDEAAPTAAANPIQGSDVKEGANVKGADVKGAETDADKDIKGAESDNGEDDEEDDNGDDDEEDDNGDDESDEEGDSDGEGDEETVDTHLEGLRDLLLKWKAVMPTECLDDFESAIVKFSEYVDAHFPQCPICGKSGESIDFRRDSSVIAHDCALR
jgi:hypothetical protein